MDKALIQGVSNDAKSLLRYRQQLIRQEEQISGQKSNVYRILVCVITAFLLIYFRAQYSDLFLRAGIICVLGAILYSIVTALLYHKNSNPAVFKYINTFLEIAFLSIGLYTLFQQNAFKTEAFALYYCFIGFAASRYSAKVTLFAALLSVGAYCLLLVIHIGNNQGILGTLVAAFNTETISIQHAIEQLLLLTAFAVTITIYVRGYKRTFIHFIQNIEIHVHDKREHQQAVTNLHRHTSQSASGDMPDSTLVQSYYVTALFCAIRNLTRRSEQMRADDVFALINEYFTHMSNAIYKASGMVSRYTGKGMMAFFGIPQRLPKQEQTATKVALELLAIERTINQERVRNNMDPMHISIALHSGTVIGGVLGYKEYSEYSLLGQINTQIQELEQLNRIYESQIIITEQVHAALDNGDIKIHKLGDNFIDSFNKQIPLFSIAPE